MPIRSSLPALALIASLSLSSACAELGLPALRSKAEPLWQQPPPALKVGPVVREGALSRVDLDNGLELLVLEDRRLPRVRLGLSVRRGAGAVDPGQAGLAAFTAELMNRGAGARDALALAKAVDDIGASLAISAGWDSIDISVSGLSRDLDLLLEILRDVALAPRFDPGEADKTRSEQLAELEAAKDSPATLASWHAMRVLYPGHRYGLPISGSARTVVGLEAEHARALHESYFVPNNAVLYASGDVGAEAWIASAQRAFGAWQPGPVPTEAPPPPSPAPAARRIVIVDKPDLVQAHIIISHDGMARTDPRRIAADLMNDTLGGSGFSSRMMQTLRSNEGLTYSVGSGFDLRRQPGPFRIVSFTRVAETRRAVDILLAELEAIAGARPQTEDELAQAKSYNVGQFGLGLETSDAVLSSLVNLSLYGLPDDALDTYRERVRDVGSAEVAEIARELLHPERAAIVLLGPAADLAAQFEDLGEVSIVAP